MIKSPILIKNPTLIIKNPRKDFLDNSKDRIIGNRIFFYKDYKKLKIKKDEKINLSK